MRTLSVLLIVAATCISAGPATRESANIDGAWESKGVINIRGERTDRTLTVSPTALPAIKSVTMALVRHQTFEQRTEEPQTIAFGPFDAICEQNTLIVKHPSGLARYSFRIDGRILRLPAFVRESDTAISIEASEIVDVRNHARNPPQPPLSVYKWRWTFSVAPETAERGTGHFTVQATPDSLKFSTEFEFKWEWSNDRAERRILILRKSDRGNFGESGGFIRSKSGDLEFYSSGGDRDGPSGIACSYVRVAPPTSGPDASKGVGHQ